MKPVKDIIKEKRIENGMTMKELSQKIGVSEGTISRWESGEIANMRRSAIIALAKVLDISPNTLMGWDDETHTIEDSVAQPAETPDEEQALTLYRQLDDGDRGEIRGTMRQMLKAEKYQLKVGVQAG